MATTRISQDAGKATQVATPNATAPSKSNPLKRLIEKVRPSKEARVDRLKRDVGRKADHQLHKLIGAAIDKDQIKAGRAALKAFEAFDPLLREDQRSTHRYRGLESALLLDGKYALSKWSTEDLEAVLKGAESFGIAKQFPTVEQLLLSTRAELLHRKLSTIHLGTTAPQAGRVSIDTLPGKELDMLADMAQALIIASGFNSPADDDKLVRGTVFKLKELKSKKTAAVDARHRRDEAKQQVEDLARTVAKKPINERPMHEVMKLKEAVDHMVNIHGSKPAATLTGLQKKLNERMLGYERRIETLLKGPVDAFDASQWNLGDLSELKKKLAELKYRLPSTVAVEQAIQADIDRRKLKAQNQFDHALRAALHSKDETAALETLSSSVNFLDKAEVLYGELGQPLDPKAFEAGVRQTFGQTDTTELKNFHAHLKGAVGEQLKDFLNQVNSLANLGPVASGYLNTLNRVLSEMVPPVALPAVPQTPTTAKPSQAPQRPPRQPGRVAGKRINASLASDPQGSVPQTSAPQASVPQNPAPQASVSQVSGPQKQALQKQAPQASIPQASDPQTRTPDTPRPTAPLKPPALVNLDLEDALRQIEITVQNGTQLNKKQTELILRAVHQAIGSSSDPSVLRQARLMILTLADLKRIDVATQREFNDLIDYKLKNLTTT